MISTEELVKIGQLELRFFVDAAKSADSMTAFEITIPPGARVPAAHYHVEVDELLTVTHGSIVFTVDGAPATLRPGDHCFVPRGSVHHFVNDGEIEARGITVLTPAKIGPAYFREMAGVVNAGAPPDMQNVREVMLRHGLVPA